MMAAVEQCSTLLLTDNATKYCPWEYYKPFTLSLVLAPKVRGQGHKYFLLLDLCRG